jgi:hypothetical protein
LEFLHHDGTAGRYRADTPVPMVAKLSDGFNKTSNFLFVGVRMWYGRVVRSYTTVPMVVKLTGTYETFNFFAFLHIPLHINIPSKMTKENIKRSIFSSGRALSMI